MKNRLNLQTVEDEAEINMTPMLDIVFIMLIFFVVTTSFVREAGIEIDRPQASTGEEQGSSAVMLAISATGEVWLDRKNIDIRMIRPNIESIKLQQPNVSVVIQADELSSSGVLVRVMDQLKLAGISNIAVATKQGEF